MIEDTIFVNGEDKPLQEAFAIMTDKWIDNGEYCAQTVFDLRDMVKKLSATTPVVRMLLDYELRASSWWVGWIGIGWMQDLVAEYFARKVRRKMNRWASSCKDQIRLEEYLKGRLK